MSAICLYFHIHQPNRLKRYRFFEIGNDHYYYDDFSNEEIITRIARNAYLPANEMLLQMINDSNKKFKVAFSISGTAIEQLQQYVPEFIDSMKKLVDTGCVEFVAGTYAHSLASLTDPEEFRLQVEKHSKVIYELFGQKPKVFKNTEFIYNDEISSLIYEMGFKGVLTEGAKHILGWKSPNYVYSAAGAPKLKLLFRNSKLTDDIAMRFSDSSWHEYPLTADKYMNWIADSPREEQLINIALNYETIGENHPRETGIFEFFKALPRFAAEKGIEFWTPSEAISKLKPVDVISVTHPISGADEARDTSAWLGNDLQYEAFNKIYSIAERVHLCSDKRLNQDWLYLQSSDHLFYMSTKHFSDGAAHALFSPYDSPYQAFTNYMNVLADFIVRVEEQYPLSIENEELNALLTTIKNQEKEIEMLNKELNTLKLEEEDSQVEKVAKEEKKPAKKKAATTKKAETKTAKTTKAKKTTKSKE